MRSQLLYVVGGNPLNQSYVVGYTPAGTKAADRPHHRSASCNRDFSRTCDWNDYNFNGPSPNVLRGALIGGPDNLDNFNNMRSDYIQNEVALDYNAGELAQAEWGMDNSEGGRLCLPWPVRN